MLRFAYKMLDRYSCVSFAGGFSAIFIGHISLFSASSLPLGYMWEVRSPSSPRSLFLKESFIFWLSNWIIAVCDVRSLCFQALRQLQYLWAQFTGFTGQSFRKPPAKPSRFSQPSAFFEPSVEPGNSSRRWYRQIDCSAISTSHSAPFSAIVHADNSGNNHYYRLDYFPVLIGRNYLL